MLIDSAIYELFADILGIIFGGLGFLTVVVGIRYFATSIPFVGLDEDLEENFGFAILALALGTACFTVAVFGILEIIEEDPNQVHWFSIALASVMGVTLVARAVKEFPTTKAVFFGLIVLIVVTGILFIKEDDFKFTIFDTDIPLWPFTAALALVVGLLVILTYFTEQTIDFFMGIIGHPVVQSIFGIIAIAHGAALYLPDSKDLGRGLWYFVKDILDSN